MRKNKFSKDRFYRRLQVQQLNNKSGFTGLDYDYWNPDAWTEALKKAGSGIERLVGKISEKRFKYLYSCEPKSR